MDRYAEIMLHDDISTSEETDVQCPSCHYNMRMKITDQYIKCIRCGEIFYIQEIDEDEY